jgi:hypothetical protein
MSSDDDTQPDYQTPDEAPRLKDGNNTIRVSQHARQRWQERSPHECPVKLETAWKNANRLQDDSIVGDSNVAQSFVYNHSDGWGIVFLVSHSHEIEVWGAMQERAIMTVLRVRDIDHDPTQAYLAEYGPHDG